MAEFYSGGSKKRRIPKSQLKKLIRKLKRSYKRGDDFQKRSENWHQQEAKSADDDLTDLLAEAYMDT